MGFKVVTKFSCIIGKPKVDGGDLMAVTVLLQERRVQVLAENYNDEVGSNDNVKYSAFGIGTLSTEEDRFDAEKCQNIADVLSTCMATAASGGTRLTEVSILRTVTG